MKKIPTVFCRNYETDRLVRNEVVPGCEWVLNGEGIATIKWDGTCCMVKDGKLYRRYDCKHGKKPPVGFIPAQDPDPVTGHWPGWVLVNPESKADKYHWAVAVNYLDAYGNVALKDGTYELIGVHFQNDPYGLKNAAPGGKDMLVAHGIDIINDCPRDFDGIKHFLEVFNHEGIVFHRGNGDMAKIKRTDFGFEWNGKCKK